MAEPKAKCSVCRSALLPSVGYYWRDPRLYCSAACKQKAYRQRKAAELAALKAAAAAPRKKVKRKKARA